MILRICPACGLKFEGDLCLGCPSCGARAVGPPLAKAERELPSWGRAFIVAALGVLMLVMLLIASIVMLAQTRPIAIGLNAFRYAAETAVWNLKWVEFPLVIAALWIGIRLARSIRQMPERFTGLWAARGGLIASGLATVIMVSLIGVTVPERLDRHRQAIDAGYYAKYYTIQRALLEYSELHKGTVPTDTAELLKEVPDPGGVIAEALRDFDPNGYKPSAVMAATSTKGKTQGLRGGALRNAATSPSADQLDHGVSFTSYELRLAGEDKILGNDDDFVMRNGVIEKVSEILPTTPSSARSNTP